MKKKHKPVKKSAVRHGFVRPDLPFSRDDANRFLPWIIGVMVFLTVLMSAGGITLNDTVVKGKAVYENSITVQVPYQSEGMEQKVYKIADTLRQTPGVHDVRLLGTAAVKELLSPWVGTGEVVDLLPLPALIDATLTREDTAKRPDIPALQAALEAQVPGTIIDDNKTWVERFSSFTRSVQLIAFTLAALMVTTTAAMIVLIARTTLKLHYRAVELIHSMGARDDYIARQFQLNAGLLTLKGAFTGTVIAAFLFIIISLAGQELHSPVLPSFALTAPHFVMFFLVPVVTSAIAVVAARTAVMRYLKTMP